MSRSWPARGGRPFVLASAPVEILEDAIRLCRANGGEFTAGSAEDTLNSQVIQSDESWRTAWKGKTHQAIQMLERFFPGERITLLAIAGGPASDWERGELRNNFCTKYSAVKLKQIGDLDDLENWLLRLPQLPMSEENRTGRPAPATPATAPATAVTQPGAVPVAFEEASNCHFCGTEFKIFGPRRHHCRDCGKSVCDAHSLGRHPLRHRDTGCELQRVCDPCGFKLQARAKASAAAEEQSRWEHAATSALGEKGRLPSPDDLHILQSQGITNLDRLSTLTDDDLLSVGINPFEVVRNFELRAASVALRVEIDNWGLTPAVASAIYQCYPPLTVERVLELSSDRRIQAVLGHDAILSPTDWKLLGEKSQEAAAELRRLQQGPTEPQPEAKNPPAVWTAAEAGDSAEIGRLLQLGVDVNEVWTDGASPLWVASQRGHVAVVQQILRKHPETLEKACTLDHRTALQTASCNGHDAIVSLLLEHATQKHDSTNTRRDVLYKKIVLLGDVKVGKTSLRNRFVDGRSTSKYKQTIGSDFGVKLLRLGGSDVKIQVWDVPGDERFRVLAEGFIRLADGFIVVFDITDATTFEHAEMWLHLGVRLTTKRCKVDHYGDAVSALRHAKILLVGNKIDLKSERVVDSNAAITLAAKHGASYFETSAEDGVVVETAFMQLAQAIIQSPVRVHRSVSIDIGRMPQDTNASVESCTAIVPLRQNSIEIERPPQNTEAHTKATIESDPCRKGEELQQDDASSSDDDFYDANFYDANPMTNSPR